MYTNAHTEKGLFWSAPQVQLYYLVTIYILILQDYNIIRLGNLHI